MSPLSEKMLKQISRVKLEHSNCINLSSPKLTTSITLIKSGNSITTKFNKNLNNWECVVCVRTVVCVFVKEMILSCIHSLVEDEWDSKRKYNKTTNELLQRMVERVTKGEWI